MATRFLTEAELREDYGDAVITKLVAAHGGAGVAVKKILDAEDEALGYLRGFTDIPASPETTSRRLKVLVGAITYYNLYSYRESRPYTVRDGYDRAIKGLSQIRSGELSIASSAEPEVGLARPAVVVRKRAASLGEQPITMDAMKDWGHR